MTTKLCNVHPAHPAFFRQYTAKMEKKVIFPTHFNAHREVITPITLIEHYNKLIMSYPIKCTPDTRKGRKWCEIQRFAPT
jgi:hypothetical protein